MATPSVNSKEWWEQYFHEHWEQNQGRSQSQYFMQLLVETLATPECAALTVDHIKVLDWGCALGDGSYTLKLAFPQAEVTGLDFSETAIANARKRYPDVRFLHTPDGSIPEKFDVIVTSNCLEHLEFPLTKIDEHLAQCAKFYVILVPFNETSPLDQHRSQFHETSFPAELGGFTKLYATVLDTDPRYWDGQQIFLVYGSPTYLAERECGETPVAPAIDSQRILAMTHHALALQREVNDTLRQQLTRHERGFQEAQQQIAVFAKENEQLKADLREQRNEIGHLDVALQEAHATKAWQWSYHYWVFRSANPPQKVKILLGAFLKALIRLPISVYHLLVPYKVRIRVWSWRHRQFSFITQWLRAHDRRLMRRGIAQLAELQQRHADAKGVIIFLPSVKWETALFQRPHQMALAFAQLGYLVIFWEKPESEIEEQLFFKVTENLYHTQVSGEVLRRIPAPIVISYSYNLRWAAKLSNPRIVYELIDHLEIFTSESSMRQLQRLHAKLVQQAQVVVGTANDLLTMLQADRPDAMLSPNAVDVDHFRQAAVGDLPIPDDIADLVASGRPIIGYYGALAEWFDADVMRYVTAQLPDYHFLLIGPVYDDAFTQMRVTDLPNVRWLGPKPYKELPAYLQAFTVATIPFTISEVLQAVSPIKLFEYMAGGRPIVSSDLIECRKYPVVNIARSKEEWVAKLQLAVQQRYDPDYQARLLQTANENTWVARCQEILDALAENDNGGNMAELNSANLDSSALPANVPPENGSDSEFAASSAQL